MLWAYGGGQKTQLNLFWYNMMVMFIFSPNTVNEELCKELYTLIFANQR